MPFVISRMIAAQAECVLPTFPRALIPLHLLVHIFMSPLTLLLILTGRVRSAPEALLHSDERRAVDEPKADDEKIHAQAPPYCKTRSFLCCHGFQQSP